MADSDFSAALKALQTHLDSQIEAFNNALKESISSVNSRFAKLHSPSSPISLQLQASTTVPSSPLTPSNIPAISLIPQPITSTQTTFDDVLKKLEIAMSASAISKFENGLDTPADQTPSFEPLSEDLVLPPSDDLDELVCCTIVPTAPFYFPPLLRQPNSHLRLPVYEPRCFFSPPWNVTARRGKTPALAPSRCLKIVLTKPILRIFFGPSVNSWREEPPGFFVRVQECINKKLSVEEMEYFPECSFDLGCVSMEKLRLYHILQDARGLYYRLPECLFSPSLNITSSQDKSEEDTTTPALRSLVQARPRCLQWFFFERVVLTWTEEPPGPLFCEFNTPLNSILADRAPSIIHSVHRNSLFNFGEHIQSGNFFLELNFGRAVMEWCHLFFQRGSIQSLSSYLICGDKQLYHAAPIVKFHGSVSYYCTGIGYFSVQLGAIGVCFLMIPYLSRISVNLIFYPTFWWFSWTMNEELPSSCSCMSGRNVVWNEFESPKVVNDGVTIICDIELFDAMENVSAALIRKVSSQTNDIAGDETTTASVLALEIIKLGLFSVTSSPNAVAIKKRIGKTVQGLVDQLEKKAGPVEGQDDIKVIASIFAWNDDKIGTMIVDAFDKVGLDGVLSFTNTEKTTHPRALSLIIANNVTEEVLAAIKASGFGERRKALLQDIAILIGAEYQTSDLGQLVGGTDIDQLGRARKIIIFKDSTPIIFNVATKDEQQLIKRELSEIDSVYDLEKLAEIIAKLYGGVAMIKVGAAWLHRAKRNHAYLSYIQANEQILRADEYVHPFGWDQEVLLPGGHWLRIRGSRPVINSLAKGLDIRLSHKVVKRVRKTRSHLSNDHANYSIKDGLPTLGSLSDLLVQHAEPMTTPLRRTHLLHELKGNHHLEDKVVLKAWGDDTTPNPSPRRSQPKKIPAQAMTP